LGNFKPAAELLHGGGFIMKSAFPKVLFVAVAGSGEDTYLAASKTEQEAIKGTDDEETATVAEYKLAAVRKRKIVTSVADA
jgi:hypothetical protein